MKKNQKQKIGQKTSPDFLLSDVETASPTTFILSDDETIDQNQQDNFSVISLSNNNYTSTAFYSIESSMILHFLIGLYRLVT
ncbi:3995_t:CDS:1, partial [Funneliformis caledonium]